MTKRNILTTLLLFVFVLGGCKDAVPVETDRPLESAVSTAEGSSFPSPEPTSAPDPIEEKIARMTTEELAGQLLVVGIEGTEPGEDARQAIEDLHVGGIILFGRNVKSASQLVALTNGLKELNNGAGNVPLFLCVDEEGGMVSRMPAEVVDLPSAYDFAQAGGDFYQRGEVLAAECAAFGFNVDFAPVLDVWSNPNNTVIGKRAFGTDPVEVAWTGRDFLNGFVRDSDQVIPVVKHFPGHGDTEADSHVGLPVVEKSRDELEKNELEPFLDVIGWHATSAVMVAHILLTQLDPLLPASLSPAVVNGLLREEMGFEGVVFTDDLTMGAIANAYGMGEAAVKAIQAGCDMALVCHGLDNAKAAYHAILFAAEDGTLSRERLEESVRRILTLKEAYGVDDAPVENPDIQKLNENIRAIIP